MIDEIKEEMYRTRLRILDAEARMKESEAEEKLRHMAFINQADVRNRVLPFIGPVTEETSEQAVDIISRWSRLSSEPIIIRFTSPGGEVKAGLVMYDTIRSFIEDGVPITTVVYGNASSIAAVLLQAGKTRVIAPHASIMFHETSLHAEEGFSVKTSELALEASKQKHIMDELITIISERSILTKSEIKRRMHKEWNLTSDDAVKFGFADRKAFK